MYFDFFLQRYSYLRKIRHQTSFQKGNLPNTFNFSYAVILKNWASLKKQMINFVIDSR